MEEKARSPRQQSKKTVEVTRILKKETLMYAFHSKYSIGGRARKGVIVH